MCVCVCVCVCGSRVNQSQELLMMLPELSIAVVDKALRINQAGES